MEFLETDQSATAVAGALLQFALVFLNRGFVMANPAQVGENAGLGYRTLKAAQR